MGSYSLHVLLLLVALSVSQATDQFSECDEGVDDCNSEQTDPVILLQTGLQRFDKSSVAVVAAGTTSSTSKGDASQSVEASQGKEASLINELGEVIQELKDKHSHEAADESTQSNIEVPQMSQAPKPRPQVALVATSATWSQSLYQIMLESPGSIASSAMGLNEKVQEAELPESGATSPKRQQRTNLQSYVHRLGQFAEGHWGHEEMILGCVAIAAVAAFLWQAREVNLDFIEGMKELYAEAEGIKRHTNKSKRLQGHGFPKASTGTRS